MFKFFLKKNFCNLNKSEINHHHSLNFINLCKLFDSIEKTSQLTEKQEKLNSFLSNFTKSENEAEKQENFAYIGGIVKISIPFLNLIQTKSDANQRDKQNPIDDNLRYQYTFDNLIKKYAIEKFNLTEKQIQAYFIKYGDLANYLYQIFSDAMYEIDYENPNLSVKDVLDYKEKIIKSIGEKSQKEKLEIFSDLIRKCKEPLEILYICRIFLNKLKIGIGERGVIKCVMNLRNNFENKKEFNELIKFLEDNIFKYKINYSLSVKSNSGDYLDPENVDFEYTLKPGQFVNLQLCKLGMDLETFLSQIQKSTLKCLIETKYDGERSQIHFDGKGILMGSRNFEDQSDLYHSLKNEIEAEITQYNKTNKLKQISNFILDGEIVCYSKKEKCFVDFQELRKKKVDIILVSNSDNYSYLSSQDKQYFFIAFDIIYINNNVVTDLELQERKRILKEFFFKKFKRIIVEEGLIIDLKNLDKAKLQIIEYFNFSRRLNCEGLVAKDLGKTSIYQFGKRRWYKLKTLNLMMTDTVDLVPIAGFIGKGSTGKLMNSFLVAAYNPDKDVYIGVCKLGTGFMQQDLEEITKRFSARLLNEMPNNYRIPNLLRPHFFFKPTEVWEVGYDSFSESMNYSIGKDVIDQNKGLSLRFPRFIRYRFDKKCHEATTPELIIELYYYNQRKKWSEIKNI